jgi:hypothetical protein
MDRFYSVAAIFVILLLSPVASAQDGRGDAGVIRTVIERQLSAFRADDGDLAFSFASPKIREIFGTPANFMAMVKTGYPQVYRPQNATFLDIVIIRGQPTQRVLLTGPDGSDVIALYFMERQADGTWLIDGCVLERPGGAAV